MKRTLAFALCLLLMLPLAACGKRELDPDFLSLADSDTKNLVALGEARDSVVKKLGEGELYQRGQDADWYQYFGGTMHIVFRDDKVVAIAADCIPRYSILDYRDGFFLVEVRTQFPVGQWVEIFGRQLISYRRYFDADGTPYTSEDDDVSGAYSSAEILCIDDEGFVMMALMLTSAYDYLPWWG